jgi:C1A family cysteine protease
MIAKFFTAIFALLSHVAADHFNLKYHTHLHGSAPIDHLVFEEMWVHYENEFGEANPNKAVSEQERKNQFANNLEDIIAHNKNSSFTYKKGINQFSDMTAQQVKSHFRLQAVKEQQQCSATTHRQSVAQPVGEVPDFWDWRSEGGVSPVKDQGACGSCWTFSTVGALEAHSLIKYGKFDSLSEQQLVDCA